jgi:hypothetical protein
MIEDKIESKFLNERNLRKLIYSKGHTDIKFPHTKQLSILSGIVTTADDINTNGWKYSVDNLNYFKSCQKDLYLRLDAYDNSLLGIAGSILNLTICANKTLVADIKILETPQGKLLETFCQNEGWLETHCFSMLGYGTVNNKGYVDNLCDPRIYICENNLV